MIHVRTDRRFKRKFVYQGLFRKVHFLLENLEQKYTSIRACDYSCVIPSLIINCLRISSKFTPSFLFSKERTSMTAIMMRDGIEC